MEQQQKLKYNDDDQQQLQNKNIMSVLFLSLLLIYELVQQAAHFHDVFKHFQNLENLYVEQL